MQKPIAAGECKTPMRSRLTFATLVPEWLTSVVPMCKHSTQKHRRYMVKKWLLPHFGDRQLSEISRQEIQVYVAHLARKGYAPRTVDYIHDVLSAILRTAAKWGHIKENPARGVDLPKLVCVRPKWALTTEQAAALLSELSPLPRTMVGLAIILGLRRGEIFALRWRHIDEQKRVLSIQEAVYDTTFSTPKTEAGVRLIPLSAFARQLIAEWRPQAESTAADALVFATSQGTPILPNNVVRRSIAPACKRLGLPKATWLTFRRTYSTWSHERGVPGKVTAQLMGHANVDTTLNVYTQVLDGSVREAADRVSGELFTAMTAGGKTIVHECPQTRQIRRGAGRVGD